MNSSLELIHGDCLQKMKDIPDNHIDLTVTSPPYDNLRDYNNTLNDWNLDKQKFIIEEMYRITAIGGVVVWIVGDATIKGSETGTSFRQALHFIDSGFNLHDTMIYQKHNFSNPSSNRYHQIFEYMFVFSKGKPKTFNPIIDRKNVGAGKIGSWGKNTVRQKDGSFSERNRKVNSEYGMRYNIWRMNTEMNPIHPAQFSEQLATDHIITWSNKGDIVLDPFLGSGTTGVSSIKLNRNFIGIERDDTYFQMATDRINKINSSLDI